jgi:hypothetical protein
MNHPAVRGFLGHFAVTAGFIPLSAIQPIQIHLDPGNAIFIE